MPLPEGAARSRLAGEIGADVAAWLARRFGGEAIDVPSARGRAGETRANLLRAAILEAGLVAPLRSTIAIEFGVTSAYVRKVRSQLKADDARPSHVAWVRGWARRASP